jgi:hypothetical protein
MKHEEIINLLSERPRSITEVLVSSTSLTLTLAFYYLIQRTMVSIELTTRVFQMEDIFIN